MKNFLFILCLGLSLIASKSQAAMHDECLEGDNYPDSEYNIRDIGAFSLDTNVGLIEYAPKSLHFYSQFGDWDGKPVRSYPISEITIVQNDGQSIEEFASKESALHYKKYIIIQHTSTGKFEQSKGEHGEYVVTPLDPPVTLVNNWFSCIHHTF